MTASELLSPLNVLPDTIVVQDQQGICTAIHANGCQLPFMLGGGLPDLELNPEQQGLYLRYLQMTLEQNSPQTFEFVFGADEQRREYEARFRPLGAASVVTVIRDVSDWRRIQDELSQHIHDLTILRQIEGELSEALSLDYILQLALDAALRLCNAYAGFIALAQNGQMTVAHATGGYDIDQLRYMLHDSDSLYWQTAQHQTATLITEEQVEGGFQPLLPATRAVMIVPLVSQERLVGLLNLETRKGKYFTQERYQLVRLVTGRIAAMLDNANLYQQTRQQLSELQHLYGELRQLEQLKTDMIRIASHDLRNPLAAITGYMELLRWDLKNLNEIQESYFRLMQEAAQRMQSITTGILSLERIEQMAKDQQGETLDLVTLVRKVYDSYAPQAQAKQQQMALVIGYQPLWVEGDPLQMEEALNNLISNAIKYTPDEGTITVSVSRQEEVATFRVRDTGYGIPESQQGRLFQPFFRARTQETKAIEGTGLGLHLVKNIVTRHNGTMHFHSIRGEGSTFGFDLPLQEAPTSRPRATGATVIS